MIKKVFFVHIPNTAGSSIKKAPFVTTSVNFQHKPIKFFFDHIAELMDFTFSFVRNPYNRFASAVLHHNYAKPENFNKFIQDIFVKNYKKIFKDWEWVHLIPQYDYLYVDDELAVHFVGKFENLESEWARLCRLIGQEYKLTHENKGEYPNASQFYDDKSREIVRKVYQKDFEAFGYE